MRLPDSFAGGVVHRQEVQKVIELDESISIQIGTTPFTGPIVHDGSPL